MPRRDRRFPIMVTPDELAMILHALAATASTFSTAALIVRDISPEHFGEMGERYQRFHARLTKDHRAH